MNNQQLWEADTALHIGSCCIVNGLLLLVWRYSDERIWRLRITCCGVNHHSSHLTRKDARDAGVAIAEILTKGK